MFRVLSQYCFYSFLITGCSLVPSYTAPPMPVDANYPANTWQNINTSKTNNESVSETSWQQYFLDSQLQSLITLALKNNRDVRTALLRVEEAKAYFGIQRADQYPNVGAQVSGQRSRIPADLSPTGQTLLRSQYQVGLGLSSWELDFWGRVRSLKEAALENYLATDEARRATTISLIAQVADGYLVLRELDERIKLAHQTISSRNTSFHIFTRRVEVGSTSRMDLAQVEALLTQAQLLGSQLEQARAIQAHSLSLLIGVQLPEPLGDMSANDDSILQEVQVGLTSDLLRQRPDIIAAEHRLKAAHANIGAAQAAFFPRILLTSSLGTASAELDGLFNSGSKAWSFMPSLSLPIFDGGRNRAGLDLAEVRKDLAVASYEKTIQLAFREVSDALSSRHWLTEQINIQQTTLSAQSERARLAKLRYDYGAVPYLEVLDAQRDLLVAEQQLVQTRRLLLSSRLNLYIALGGGSQSFSEATPADTQPLYKTRDTK